MRSSDGTRHPGCPVWPFITDADEYIVVCVAYRLQSFRIRAWQSLKIEWQKPANQRRSHASIFAFWWTHQRHENIVRRTSSIYLKHRALWRLFKRRKVNLEPETPKPICDEHEIVYQTTVWPLVRSWGSICRFISILCDATSSQGVPQVQFYSGVRVLVAVRELVWYLVGGTMTQGSMQTCWLSRSPLWPSDKAVDHVYPLKSKQTMSHQGYGFQQPSAWFNSPVSDIPRFGRWRALRLCGVTSENWVINGKQVWYSRFHTCWFQAVYETKQSTTDGGRNGRKKDRYDERKQNRQTNEGFCGCVVWTSYSFLLLLMITTKRNISSSRFRLPSISIKETSQRFLLPQPSNQDESTRDRYYVSFFTPLHQIISRPSAFFQAGPGSANDERNGKRWTEIL